MGIFKYTHPKYYAKRAVNWEGNKRQAEGGCLSFFLVLMAIAAVVYAFMWLLSLPGHLLGLTPTAHQLFNHDKAWLHDHYPLVGLRYVATVAILGLAGGVVAYVIERARRTEDKTT